MDWGLDQLCDSNDSKWQLCFLWPEARSQDLRPPCHFSETSKLEASPRHLAYFPMAKQRQPRRTKARRLAIEVWQQNSKGWFSESLLQMGQFTKWTSSEIGWPPVYHDESTNDFFQRNIVKQPITVTIGHFDKRQPYNYDQWLTENSSNSPRATRNLCDCYY